MSQTPPVPDAQKAPWPAGADDSKRTAERDALVAETKARAEEQAAEADAKRRLRTGVGVGLGIGSAAIVAALLYAKNGKAQDKARDTKPTRKPRPTKRAD